MQSLKHKTAVHCASVCQQGRPQVAARALIALHPFKPEKLRVSFDNTLTSLSSQDGSDETCSVLPRKYTLTHSDFTAQQVLTVGLDYNLRQISGWYNKLMRDEVLAEWRFDDGTPSLHLYCLVSGHLPRGFQSPAWRDNIFRRDVPLVLDAFIHAEAAYLSACTDLKEAAVFVHFQSDEQAYSCTELWGTLGDRQTWKPVPRCMLLQQIKEAISARPWLLPIICWCLGSELAAELRHELATDATLSHLTAHTAVAAGYTAGVGCTDLA